MRFVRLNSDLYRSEYFWLGFVFAVTAGHLPSWVEVISTWVFVALVWQIKPGRKRICLGLTFAVYYGWTVAALFIARALPKEALSRLGSTPTSVPVQMAFMTSLASIGAWIAIACVALLRYYDEHRGEPYAACLRFVAASAIVWGSFTFLAQQFAPPARGIYAPLEPLFSLTVFVAVPASFFLWHLYGRTWIGLVLRAGAALLIVGVGYWMLALAGMFFRVPILVPLLSLFTLAGTVASKIFQPYQGVVILAWMAVVPALRLAAEGGPQSSGKWNGKYPVMAPVFALAVTAMVVSFTLDAHKQQIKVRAKLAEDAQDELAKQKINAFVRWRISLPRDAPKVLAALGPPVVGPDGTAYVVARSEGRLHAIDPSGQARWSFSGVISAEPAIGRDAVYVVGNDKHLYALDGASGQTRWSTMFAEGRAVICTGPAAGADGTVYTLSQERPSALILNATSSDGQPIWRFTTPSDHMCSIRDQVDMFPQLLPSPVVGNTGVIYFTNEGTLHAIDSNGTEKWSASTDRPVSRVLLGRNGAIYTYGENITAFNPDGQMQWARRRNSAPSVAPALGENGTIYLPDYTRSGSPLIALYPDGSEKWSFSEIPGISTVAAGPNGIIYVSSPGLSAIDADGHRLDWNYGYGTPAVAPDGTIYSVENDGDLYRLNPPSANAQLTSQ